MNDLEYLNLYRMNEWIPYVCPLSSSASIYWRTSSSFLMMYRPHSFFSLSVCKHVCVWIVCIPVIVFIIIVSVIAMANILWQTQHINRCEQTDIHNIHTQVDNCNPLRAGNRQSAGWVKYTSISNKQQQQQQQYQSKWLATFDRYLTITQNAINLSISIQAVAKQWYRAGIGIFLILFFVFMSQTSSLNI